MGAGIDKLFLDFQAALAGRYSLERELGRGGMGVVYLAREIRLDRPVAIKLLPPALALHQPLRERFLREARIAAHLSHPHIVPIHAVDEVGDFVFYAMAYVEGETLAQRIDARGPLPPHEAARVVREVAWALAYAHQKGVVHRDIKSENILLESETRRALVADFGIASLRDARGATGPEDVVGTPAFMSPEQAAGEPMDGRSDLYSLGVVAFHALTGELPFTGRTAAAVMGQHLGTVAPDVTDLAPATPNGLARAIARCLSKAPAERFQSGEELAEDLSGMFERSRDVPVAVRSFLRSVPRRLAVLAVGIALLVPIVQGAVDYEPVIGIVIGVALLFVVRKFAGGALVELVRGLSRVGYGYDDVVQAVRHDVERRREELAFQSRDGPERWVLVRSLLSAGLAVLLFVVESVLDAVPPTTFDRLLIAGLAIVGGSGLVVYWRRDLWTESVARFWTGFPGRWIFRWAGVAPGPTQPAASSRTEVAIGAAAEALFAGLPRDAQRALGDLPAVVRRIETWVVEARRRVDEADAALGSIAASPAQGLSRAQLAAVVADLRVAKEAASRRQGELITALETIRLDLLRLRAGTGSVESITAAIGAAERIGQAADRAIVAQEAAALRRA
jgi:predicted Ser/Thr protein kinase